MKKYRENYLSSPIEEKNRWKTYLLKLNSKGQSPITRTKSSIFDVIFDVYTNVDDRERARASE